MSRTERFECRLDPATAARLNRIRGLAPASAWIARAVERDLDREEARNGIAASAPPADVELERDYGQRPPPRRTGGRKP